MPWPISERAMRMTTVSSGLITTQALTSGEPSAARSLGAEGNVETERTGRAPAAAEPTTKGAAIELGMWFMALSSRVRGGVDRRAHLLEGAAAADIGDGLVDVRRRSASACP